MLFRQRHLSEVVAAQLTDGRRVVVKARPYSSRLAGRLAVQAALAEAGFPCPVPVAGPGRIGEYAVTAETLIAGGDLLSPANGGGPFATLLARLIKTSPFEFIAAYQISAGRTWTGRQVQMAWTAGLWVRLFNARKDATDGGGPQLDRLAKELPERLSSAGLRHG